MTTYWDEAQKRNDERIRRLMADYSEALIGAAFLDRGYERAAAAVVRHLIEDSHGIL